MDKRINALMTEYICSGCLIRNCASMINCGKCKQFKQSLSKIICRKVNKLYIHSQDKFEVKNLIHRLFITED